MRGKTLRFRHGLRFHEEEIFWCECDVFQEAIGKLFLEETKPSNKAPQNEILLKIE